MQISYKAFTVALYPETLRACRQCLQKADKPGMEDRQGYFDALASAPTLVRYFLCKGRTSFDYEAAYSYFLEKANGIIDRVHECRHPCVQHYEFAQARGFYKAARLLDETAAQMLHTEEE